MKNKNHYLNYFLKKTFVLLLIFVFIFGDVLSFLPASWQEDKLLSNLKINEAMAAAVGDGVMIYDQTTPTTGIQDRNWTQSSATVSAPSNPFPGSGNSKHIFAKGAPTRDEIMAGIEDNAGLLTIYKSTDGGTTWVSQWTATVGDGNLRRFDIAYEMVSGRAFVIYSANVGTTNEIRYRYYNGTSWTAELTLDAIRTTGTVYGVKLAERAGTNEIGLVWVDTNLDISANLWTGSAWYGEPAAALSTSIARSGGATPSTVPTTRGYDITFESTSGNLMIAWGDDSGSTTQLDPKYIIKTPGGAWGTGTAIINLTEDGEMLDISSSPLSNKIALVTCAVDSGADCNFIVWSGTAWGTVASDTTAGSPIAGDGSNNTEWLVSGANEVAIFTYNDAAAGGIDWYTSTNGATPVAQTDNSTAPAVAGLDRAGFSKASPSDPSQALFFFGDANSDIYLKKASLSGTTVTWSSPTGASTAIETATPFIGFNPIGFAYDRYAAVADVTTLGTDTDPAAASVAPGAAATDVNMFTLQTSAGTEAVTSVTVNLSTNSGIGLLSITDSANTVLGSTASPVTGSNTINVTGLTAGVSILTFKVRVTPLSHIAMPAPPGGAYAITAPVTAWAGSNTHAGSDTNINALTIDNASPNGATLVSGTAGSSANNLNWTTSNSTDFDTVSGSVIYRWTGAVAGSEVPVEGTAAVLGNTNGTATIACVVSSAASTALSRTDGTGGSADCTTAALTNGQAYTYKIFQQGINSNYDIGVAMGTFTPVAPLTLTIGATAGSQIVNLNSGDTSKFANDIACSSEANCAAFKMSASSGSITITAIKVSEIGSVAANVDLSNPTLIYDTDANYSNGTTGTFGTAAAFAADQTVTFSNAGLTIPSGSTYYFYIRFDMKSATPTYPAGGQAIDFQITNNTDIVTSGTPVKTGAPATLAGSTITKPTVISYTNSTETALNYAAACTTCGGRIGPGAPYRQTLVISGYGFGTDPGLGSRSTATNKVEIVGAATDVLTDDASANTNVSAWSNTSITIRTDSNIAGNTDPDFGTNYGGASALKITAGSQAAATNLNFYLFPQVTSLTVPTAVANAAREYDAADTDGIITLNGTRFGSAATGGWVRILGCDSTTCTAPSGSAVTNSWNNTAIAVQVPAVIADNIYTGSVIMQQGLGTANKSHTYTTTGFRILPRLTSLSPTSGAVGAAITVNGNHFCQNNAVCPTVFDTNNRVTFTTADNAIVFTSWSNTAIVTAVPASALDGVVYAMSNAYQSNNSAAFSVLSPTPNNPTALNQLKDAALTIPITTGSTSSSTNTYFTMSMLADFAGGTLYPQIEYQPVGTAFSCIGTSTCAQAAEGLGKAGPGPIDCSVLANGCAITTTPTDGVYHWQARIRHNSGGSNYYSNWVPYGANSESATDFKIDKTGPVITFAGVDTCASAVTSITTNGATISWTLNESGTGQLEYSKNSNLTASVNSALSPSAFSHSFPLTNLDSNTTYYFRAKSVDPAGNATNRPSVSPYCSFTTGSVTQPAKTTKFYIGAIPGILSGGTATTSSFSVYVPENSVSVISAFVELSGFSPFAGTNNVSLSVNGQATSTYSVASGANSFKVLYPVSGANLNFDPIGNTLNLSPSLDLNITSAELVLTYSFAP